MMNDGGNAIPSVSCPLNAWYQWRGSARSKGVLAYGLAVKGKGRRTYLTDSPSGEGGVVTPLRCCASAARGNIA
ncbi:hypothetical protein EVAR_46402_1 [Eumeta japonica]|uniref:Uncharacterized protein n=1 Tax=Eumeta variegata TaxID=151549 RepID=A0A4C1WYI7_EUMVA|nr:hypothetical protein EVAR_46402_1 [Eumeta japonica]